MNGIRRIFYDKTTGDKIHEIGRNGSFTLPTIEQDIATFTALSERNRDTFDVLELAFGEKQSEFSQATSYRVNPTTKEIEFNYDPLFTLEDYKTFKLEELSQKCKEAILGQFSSMITNVDSSSTTYKFSNDNEAQSNFKDAMWAFENNKITTVKWTAYDDLGQIVRIDLNMDQLINVNVDRLTHQQMNVSKLRDTLQPQVDDATTKEQVESITW